VNSQKALQDSLEDLQKKHRMLVSMLDSHAKSILEQTSMSRHELETSHHSIARKFDRSLEVFKSLSAVIEAHAVKSDHDPTVCKIHEHPEIKPARVEDIQNAILKTFKYLKMETRHETIREAHAKTFRWALNAGCLHSSWDSLTDWLDSDGDLYWVTGKAASGKSTFMKYLFQEPAMKCRLEGWAGRKDKLICASFFFWDLGSSIQKSQAGLLLSLLYTIFTEEVCLLKEVFPELYEQLLKNTISSLERLGERWHKWSVTELDEILQRLTCMTVSRKRFCFFIDGLDEFSGHDAEIAAFVLKIAHFPNVKVCVSSRPLMVFEQEFESCKKLRLHELTRKDIQSYIHYELSRHRRFAEVSSSAPEETYELTRKILDMSSGVFLWVRLVVESLLDGFTNYDSISDLHMRLRELPSELHELYHFILRSISPPFYMLQASQLLQTVAQAIKPLPVLSLSIADDDDTSIAIRAKVGLWPAEDCKLRVKVMTAKINSRCRGLLEVRAGHHQRSEQRDVHFLHLTVKEFLERPEIWKELLAHTAGTNFNPNVSLLRGSLFTLKTLYSEIDWSSVTQDHIDELIQYAVAAENSAGRPQVALIESLDETAAHLWSKHTKARWKSSPDDEPGRARLPYWTQHIQKQGGYFLPVTNFVVYAIFKGLTLYVQAKHGSQLLSLNRIAESPLLAYAVGSGASEDGLRYPHPSMISMLLKAGLGPNPHFAESTVWLQLLGKLVRQSRTDKAVDPVWATVCKLLLLHGADIAATLPTTFHPIDGRRMGVTEAIDFIFSRGSHDTFLEIREIVAARERSTRLATQQRSNKRKRQDLLAMDQ
jgi:hypothetical protein